MTVYLHYTQEELNEQYDQRSLVPDPSPWMGPCASASKTAKETFTCIEDIAYGDHEEELLDLYLPGGKGSWPIVVYCHGGAWRALTKDESGFPAMALVPTGIAVAALNFSLAPAARLGTLVDQVQRATLHLHGNAAEWNLDPDRFFAMGHSSGAYLASMLGVADWAELGGPTGLIKGLISGSGPYDLEPVRLSARNDYLFLDEETATALTPQTHLKPGLPPAVFTWGGGELEEFQRQSRDLADAWEAQDIPVERVFLDGLNHFQVGAELMNPESPTIKAAVRLIQG